MLMRRVRLMRATVALLGLVGTASDSIAAPESAVPPLLRGIHGWPHSSSPQPAGPTDDAAGRCKSMVGDYSDLEDAPSQVITADLVAAVPEVP
jgi:hypothetical protein